MEVHGSPWKMGKTWSMLSRRWLRWLGAENILRIFWEIVLHDSYDRALHGDILKVECKVTE